MTIKLEQCNNCERWNDDKNINHNRLWCKLNCKPLKKYEMKTAMDINKHMIANGAEPTEMGKRCIGL